MLIQVTTSLCYDPRFISLKEKPTSFLSSLLYSISSSSYVHFLYSASSLDIMGVVPDLSTLNFNSAIRHMRTLGLN